MTDDQPIEQSLASVEIDVQKQLEQLESHFSDLQRQVQRLQRLAALGTMSAMLAHEFNNLMTPIVGYAQFALQRKDPAQMATALEKTLKHSRRAASLCEKVLGMASDQQMGPTPTPVRPLALDALECLGRDLEKDGIEVGIDVDESLTVRAVAASLQQVLFNLVINARQATLGKRGRLTISAARTEQNEIRICVSDSGQGIRPEHIDQVFEPFFTTKSRQDQPDRRGLGLGLTISRQLIEESGGRLTVESRYGHGATFSIWLPSAD